MLEARKLSDQSQNFAKGGFLSALSLASLCLAIAVMLSVWMGLVLDLPKPDPSQDQTVLEHAKVVESSALIANQLSGSQEITSDVFLKLSTIKTSLDAFVRTSAQSLKADVGSRDPNAWPGRANVILDDLNVLLAAQESLLSAVAIRGSLSDLYKTKGLINPTRFPELSATRGFYLSSLEWLYLTSTEASGGKMSWTILAKGKAPWRQMNSQLATLTVESKLEDDTGRGKVAKELLLALGRNDLLLRMQNADPAWVQAWAARERLLASVENLPPLPQISPQKPGWTWDRWSFPGTTAEGLQASMACLVLALGLHLADILYRRRRLRQVAEQWLGLTQDLENVVRSVDAPVVNAVARMEALSADFSTLVDQLRALQERLQNKPANPSLEDEAWNTAVRMQTDLEAELSLLREKLLNIHLQFCSGTTRENLVYDLAFTTEAVDTIAHSARDLGRSFHLLNTRASEDKQVNADEDMNDVIRSVNGLKNSVKRVATHLQDLSGRLQIAVEDVPEGRRFDFQPRRDEQGRLRADT